MKIISREPPRDQKFTIEISYGELHDIKNAIQYDMLRTEIYPKEHPLNSLLEEIERVLNPLTRV